jgi:hypothetical protein
VKAVHFNKDHPENVNMVICDAGRKKMKTYNGEGWETSFNNDANLVKKIARTVDEVRKNKDDLELNIDKGKLLNCYEMARADLIKYVKSPLLHRKIDLDHAHKYILKETYHNACNSDLVNI